MHSKFSVVYSGDSDSFLAELNNIVTSTADSVVSENVVLKSYNYSASYSVSRVKVNFNVEYLSTPSEIFQNEPDLINYVFDCLVEKKENFEAGLALSNPDIPQDLGERIFELANARLENTFHQVQVSTYECMFKSYDNYIEFNFGVIYVLPELLSNEFADSNEDLLPLIYNNLMKRNNSFAIHLIGNQEKINVFAAYKKSLENDEYLNNSIKSMSYQSINFARSKIVVFNLEYLATKEEEDEIEKAADKIIGEIITGNMDVYQKIKAVHDYIILNVAYENNKEYDSAYEALTEGKAICSGYTMLAEKLFRKLGLKTLIVNSPEMKHTWNMINIDENWYHIDLTWDDPVPDIKGRILYIYFLVSDWELNRAKDRKHTWNRSEYPVATKNYKSIM